MNAKRVRSLTDDEVAVYEAIVALQHLEQQHRDDHGQLPAAGELAKLATLYERLEMLRTAAHDRSELTETWTRGLLEWVLRESKATAESEAVTTKYTGMVKACEALIKRREHDRQCTTCHALATHVSPHGDPHCEACARHSQSFEMGRSFAVAEQITQFVELMCGPLKRDELVAAVREAAEGREPTVGALRRHLEDRERERREDKEGLGESESWRQRWTPIEGESEEVVADV